MPIYLLCFLFMCILISGQELEVTSIKVGHKNGQTFITWQDVASGEAGAKYTYSVFRSELAITEENKGKPFLQGISSNSGNYLVAPLTKDFGLVGKRPLSIFEMQGVPLPSWSGLAVFNTDKKAKMFYAVVAYDSKNIAVTKIVPGKNTITSPVSEEVKALPPKSEVPIKVYGAPVGSPHNNDFTVQVKTVGGTWQELFTYDAIVDHDLQGHVSFAYFDVDQSAKIEVKVIKKAGGVKNAKIRPDIAGLSPTITGDTITFTMIGPQKISLEINGDLYHNLFIFANPMEDQSVNLSAPGMHYFGPGMHNIDDGKGAKPLKLVSGDTVYIAGGAIVNGNINIDGAKDINIMGRGILSGNLFNHKIPDNEPKPGMLVLSNAKDVVVKDIVLLNTSGWNITISQSEGVTFDNLKIIGWTVNSDGINPCASSRITINDCFIRNDDDCISIKLAYGVGGSTNTKGCHNILIQNCIFWADKGRTILIGPESFSAADKIYDNILVRNIDVLWSKNFDIDWARGVLAINCADGATVKNVAFEDIRVEATHNTVNLVNFRLEKTPFNVSPGEKIENINFNRVSLKTPNQKSNVIFGLDSAHLIEGIHFTDLKINGRFIHNADEGGFQLNAFVKNITFVAPK